MTAEQRRVVIDGRMMDGTVSGVATYAASLFRAVNSAGLAPLLLCDGRGPRETAWRRWWRAAMPGARRLEQDGPAGALLGATGLFREAHVHFSLYGRLLELETTLEPGIMHWTYPVPLRLRGWTNLYTVHDAIPLTAPHLTTIDPQRHARVLHAILRSGGRLLTVTEASRDEIATVLGISTSTISVCWQGVEVGQVGQMPFADRGYFLFCGTIEPRKNIAAVIDAHRRADTGLALWLAGPLHRRDAVIEAALAANPAARLLGQQERPQLERLIAGARGLLLVSRAEGFGLPIAEAQIAGTPVIASCHGAQAEVAGEAALLVNPEDEARLAAAMQSLAGDRALWDRLRAAGLARADLFSIPAFGARMASVYRRVASTGARPC